nr:hypothetical protein [Tanacetum cinerariifolium]
MGYEHLSTILETKSDEVIKSSVEKLVPIPSECEVTSDDENECDVLVCEDSSTFDVCKDHFEILSDSNNDDFSSDDDAFEDVEYVEASPLDSELVSLEEENVVYQEEEEFDLEDILQIQDVILREKLLSINRLIADIESLNDNPTPDHNSIPTGIKNFSYDSEGDIHFLEELLVADSIPFPENESSYPDHYDDPSFPRPPPEQLDVEFFFDLEPNSGEVILAVINNNNELYEDECFDPGGEINVFANVEDHDYFPFIFVIRIFLPYLIYPEVFLYFSPLVVKTLFLTLASPFRAGGISLGWNFHVL